MRKILIPAGTLFGRLTVLKEVQSHRCPSGQTKRYFQCKCICGEVVYVSLGGLRAGKTKSCGCLQKDRVRDSNRTHGMCHSPEYGIWNGMISRCHNPNEAAFPLYGGRGITVCERWRESFAAFYDDMGPRPSCAHSLDRINNYVGYSPENCRWVTWTVQQRNKRSNHLLTYDGRTLCISEWAQETGISPPTLYYRLKRGWTAEQALTLPIHARVRGSKSRPAFWKAYHPARSLPFMPKRQNDWWRLLRDISRENLH